MAAAEAQHHGDGEQADDGEDAHHRHQAARHDQQPDRQQHDEDGADRLEMLRLRFERRHDEQMHHHEQREGGQDAIAPLVMKAVEQRAKCLGNHGPGSRRLTAGGSDPIP